MTVICSGVRGSDGTPLVLVRCDCCGEVWWMEDWQTARPWVCGCDHRMVRVRRQPTLAEATAPASEVA